MPSAVAGLSVAFSLPPWGWWPLAFVGAAILYWRLAGLAWRSRLLAGWVAGLGCFVPGLWWAASFNWYGAVVLMAVEALSMAAAAVLVPARGWRLPAFAGAFTLLEALRVTWPFGGLPLGGVFLGQADGPLLAAARLGGPLLLTALVWLGGGAAAEVAGDLVARWRASGRAPAPRAAAVGAAAAVLVVAIGIAGALAPDGGPAVRRIEVAAIQGGGRRGVPASEVAPASVLAAQVAGTVGLERRRAADPPSLVVWPEDVIALHRPLAGSSAARLMASIARRLDATVVAGLTETVSSHAFRNEAVAWGPGGRVVGVYEKVHRVPFGEYVPDRSFFAHFASLTAVPLDAVPGHGTGLLRTPAAPIGVMVSYEVFFAGRARSSVRAGAQLLVVPTNTSSYASSQVPAAEVAADRLQAVAEGRDLVQAAPAGYSTIVDSHGVVRRRSVLGARQAVVASVSLRAGRTVYEMVGDLPVVAAAAIALGAALAVSAVRRRRWSDL